MPTLKITRLHCVKKRDPVGKDEIEIYTSVDGGPDTLLSGPHFLDKSKNDDEVNLNDTRSFHDTVRIRLKERNGGRGGSNDLDLGTRTVYEDERRNTTQEANFSANNGGVFYELNYQVS